MKYLVLITFALLYARGVAAQEKQPDQQKQVEQPAPAKNNKDAKDLEQIKQTDVKIPSGTLTMQPSKPEPVKPTEKWLYEMNLFSLDLNEKKALLDRIQWKASFFTSFNYFNNSDLRVLNSTNQTSIEDTDDKLYFMLSGAEIDTFFPIHPRLDFRVGLFKAGFWGHDQLGGRDANNDIKFTRSGANTVNFDYLYFDIHFLKEPTSTRRADVRVGRQGYSIGGEIERDFYLDDTLDAIVFKADSKFGSLNLLLIDVYANGSNTSDVYSVQYLSFDDEKVDGFDGDVNTYRYGFVYMFPFIRAQNSLKETHIEARAFYYFARFGGLNDGGSDRTNKGTTGNFSDNDFSTMKGVRLNAGFRGYVRGQITYAESAGIDRKRPTVAFTSQDVDTNGQSWMLDVEVSLFKRIVLLYPSVYWSEGGKYFTDGRPYSHGFVGFKGDHAGGILSDLNWGMYPSAYVDDDGIDDTPFERQRKSGTFIRHLGAAIGKPDVIYFRVDWWRMEDTNRVGLVNGATPGISSILSTKYVGPDLYEQQIRVEILKYIYPTAATQLLAYRRFSTPMAEEMNFTVDWNVLPNWRAWAVVGVLRPMRYYATAGLEQGVPQGTARFTGMQVGTSFYF